MFLHEVDYSNYSGIALRLSIKPSKYSLNRNHPKISGRMAKSKGKILPKKVEDMKDFSNGLFYMR